MLIYLALLVAGVIERVLEAMDAPRCVAAEDTMLLDNAGSKDANANFTGAASCNVRTALSKNGLRYASEHFSNYFFLFCNRRENLTGLMISLRGCTTEN